MIILAVDDERRALNTLIHAIESAVPDATVVGFGSVDASLKYAKTNKIDVAFLDIQMPEMNGLLFAMNLKEIDPKTNIVFVTGHSQYALDAMELHPSGYVMKPATKEKVELELKNLRYPVRIESDKRVQVQTFGNFEVFVDGLPLKFVSARSKELFAYLIDRRGTSATPVEIAAVLWEDKVYDKSLRNQIQAAISEMMKTLKAHDLVDIINKSWNQISIDRLKIRCDYYDMLDMVPAAVNAYCGEYMASYSWAEMTAAALSSKLSIQ